MGEMRKQTQHKKTEIFPSRPFFSLFSSLFYANNVCLPDLQATRTSSFGREKFAALMKSAPELSGVLGTPSS